MRRLSLCIAAAVLCAGLAFEGAAGGAERRQEFPEPARGPVVDVAAAPVVVVGHAKESRSRRVADGSFVTRTTFVVEEEQRGDVPAEIVVRTRGGEVGDVVQVREHEPVFVSGQRSRLFLEPSGGEYTVVGAEQGKQDAGLVACGSGYCLNGQEWPTSAFPLRYRVNPNTDDVGGESPAVQRAFQTWEDDAGSIVDFTFDGATAVATSSCDDRVQAVYWATSSANFLGTATWCFDGSDNTTHFDIEMNDAWNWRVQCPCPGTNNFDVESVALHEIGHALGLDHVSDNAQVMHPSLTQGSAKRTLGSGDVNGIRALYPGASGGGGTGSGTVAVADNAFTPAVLKLATQGTTVQWDFNGPSAHTVTERVKLGAGTTPLFNSGAKPAGSTFSSAFSWAGTFKYVCTIHSVMAGTVKTPLVVSPRSGTRSTTFTLTLGSAPPPPGLAFDVQVKRPGTSSYAMLVNGTTATSVAFVPDASGTFVFRARLRNTTTGKASGWSVVVKVPVS